MGLQKKCLLYGRRTTVSARIEPVSIIIKGIFIDFPDKNCVNYLQPTVILYFIVRVKLN